MRPESFAPTLPRLVRRLADNPVARKELRGPDYALVGLFFSTRLRTILAATTATLVTCLASVIALPLLQSLLESPLRRMSRFHVDWHTLLVTTNIAGVLSNLMDPVTHPGLWLPALGYLLPAAAVANVCYIVAWRSPSW